MTAWIMVDSKGVPFTRNFYFLYEGFNELGEEIKTYTAADVMADSLPVSEDDIICGHIEHCRRSVKKLNGGKEIPNLDYPKELMPFMGRNFYESTGRHVRDLMTVDNPKPIFVKSVDQKLITGFVCDSFKALAENCSINDVDTKVYISDVVNFRSEYRAYIHRHSIGTCLRYTGDYDLAPSKETLEAMLDALKDARMPIAYSIDVGIIVDKGVQKTLLVECNDGFALGNYGWSPRKYAEFTRDRWYQMVREGR